MTDTFPTPLPLDGALMTDEIKFGALPPAHTRAAPSRWAEVAAALIARPSEWAMVKEAKPVGVAVRIRNGGYMAFRPVGAFEATCRNTKNGKADIWARFVGVPND